MNLTKLFNTRTTSGVFAAGLCMLVAQPCFAQSKACVNLLVGAGYAAWAGVHFGDSYYWTGSFGIGSTGCVTLPVSGMVDGAPYNVVVSAVLAAAKWSAHQPRRPIPQATLTPWYTMHGERRLM